VFSELSKHSSIRHLAVSMPTTDIMRTLMATLQSRARSIDYLQKSELKLALRKSNLMLEMEVGCRALLTPLNTT